MIERFSFEEKDLISDIFCDAPMTNGLCGWLTFKEQLSLPDALCFGDLSEGNESCFLFEKKDENLYRLRSIMMFEEMSFEQTINYTKFFANYFGPDRRIFALAEHVWTRIFLSRACFTKTDEIRQYETTHLDIPDSSCCCEIRDEASSPGKLFPSEDAFPPFWRLYEIEYLKAAAGANCALGAYTPKGQLAGALLAAIEPDKRCDLMRLSVLPEYRGQHIALSLIREMKARADSLHAALYCVNTNLRNTAAVSLYQKVGFDNIVRIEPLYREDFRFRI